MPPEPSLRAVAYVREPTEEQGQGFSPDAQREAIRRFAAENGLALVGEYCDFHSGWKRAGGRPEFQRLMMRWAWFALAAAALVAVGGAGGSCEWSHDAELPRNICRDRRRHPGRSCGRATISELGHVSSQCVAFDVCGRNCELRTITFDDGSTLLMHESIVGLISPGESSAAGTNAPQFLQITQTIVGGTGRFAGASGSGSGRVNLAADALITTSGTITLQ